MSFLGALSQVFTPSKRAGASAGTRSRSPDAPTWEDDHLLATFMTTWEEIKNVFTSPTLRQEPLESTALATWMETLLDCLAMENSMIGADVSGSGGDGTTGECMEMLLKTDIPSRLVTLSLPDEPVGSKGLTIKFFSSLVVLMDEHFVVHAKVHKPLIRLLRSCVEPEDDYDGDEGNAAGGWRTKDRAYEESVVETMCHLCSRIKTFPELLVVFLHSPPPLSPSWPSSPTGTSFSGFSGAFVPPPQRKSVHFSDSGRRSPVPSLASTSATAARLDSGAGSPSLMPFPSPSPTFAGPSSVSGSNASGSRGVVDSDMLIFSYLLRFLHRERRTGDLARTGLLFLMELAMGRRFMSAGMLQSPDKRGRRTNQAQTQNQADAALALGEWVLDSDFSDVLAAGLGAAYGLLPSKLSIRHPEDKVSAAMADRMVLEGFDAPEEEEDEEKQEDDETAMKGLGLGFSSSEDFKFQFDLFIKLLEFTQDVLRRAPPSVAQALSPTLLSSPIPGAFSDISSMRSSPSLMDAGNGRPAELVSGAITSTVLASIRKLFLGAILYPSLLESSEHDGSAVAVMSYLEAIFRMLESDGRLADMMLRYLMSDEDDEGAWSPNPSPAKARVSLSPPMKAKRAKEKKNRRQSGALQLIQAETQKANPRGHRDAEYFTSLGRFTLQDLLVANILSTDPATVTAALKLFHTILTKHDRHALGLLDVIPDPQATAFPFPPSDLGPTDEAEDLVTPNPLKSFGISELDEESDDEFVYPGTAPSNMMATPAGAFATPIRTPGSGANLGRMPASPAPIYEAHRGDVSDLTHLIDEIDPSIDESAPPTASTAFERYLEDAEEQLLANASFRRCLNAGPAMIARPTSPTITYTPTRPPLQRRGESPTDPFANPSTQGTPRPSAPPGSQDLVDDPLLRHRLSVDAPLVSSLLACLAGFFSHPPEVNLALTGVLATLASCPTRSLEGWLVPTRSRRAGDSLLELLAERSAMEDRDHQSVDFAIDEMSKHGGTPAMRDDVEGDEEPAVVEILRQLAEQVQQHRESIRGFDRYLKERKQGLLFAENLADALDPGEGEMGGPSGIPVVTVGNEPLVEEPEEDEPTSPQRPVPKQAASWTAFFTPTKKSASASTGALSQTTPDNVSRAASAQMARGATSSSTSSRASRASSGATLTAASAGASSPEMGRHRLSPFAKHYEQTRSIKLTPRVATTPASRKRAKRRGHGQAEDETEMSMGGGLDTPTKKTFSSASALPPTSSSTITPSRRHDEAGDDDEDEEDEGDVEDRRPAASEVSLSMLLGNVVLLEESIKELAAIISSRSSLGIDPIRLF